MNDTPPSLPIEDIAAGPPQTIDGGAWIKKPDQKDSTAVYLSIDDRSDANYRDEGENVYSRSKVVRVNPDNGQVVLTEGWHRVDSRGKNVTTSAITDLTRGQLDDSQGKPLLDDNIDPKVTFVPTSVSTISMPEPDTDGTIHIVGLYSAKPLPAMEPAAGAENEKPAGSFTRLKESIMKRIGITRTEKNKPVYPVGVLVDKGTQPETNKPGKPSEFYGTKTTVFSDGSATMQVGRFVREGLDYLPKNTDVKTYEGTGVIHKLRNADLATGKVPDSLGAISFTPTRK